MLFAKTQLVPTTTTTTCYFWTNKGLTEVSWCLSSCTKCLLVLPTLIFFLLVEPIMISGVCSHGEVNPQRPRHQYSAALCCTSRTKTWTLCFTHAFKWGHRKREGRWSRNVCQSRIGCRVLILWFKTTVMDCNEDQENSNNCSLCEFTHTQAKLQPNAKCIFFSTCLWSAKLFSFSSAFCADLFCKTNYLQSRRSGRGGRRGTENY